MQAFAMLDSDFCSPFTRKADASDTCHVLSEIVDVCLSVYLTERNGREGLHITDRTRLLGSNVGRRDTAVAHSVPLRVVKFRSTPAFLLQTCVVVLAGIDAVEGYRTR